MEQEGEEREGREAQTDLERAVPAPVPGGARAPAARTVNRTVYERRARGPAIPNPRTTARAIDIPYRAIARPFRPAGAVSATRDIVLGPTRAPPSPWLPPP